VFHKFCRTRAQSTESASVMVTQSAAVCFTRSDHRQQSPVYTMNSNALDHITINLSIHFDNSAFVSEQVDKI